MKKLVITDYAKKRGALAVFAVLLLAMIYFFKDGSYLLRAVTAFSTMLFFYMADHLFDLKYRRRHYVYMFLIVIVGVLLSPFYFLYPNFDKMQHLLSPLLISSLIFHVVNRHKLELKWKLVFTFFITFAVLGLFEIGEFMVDSLFDFKLQGVYLRDFEGIEKFHILMDPLQDTMIDLVLGLIGTLTYLIAHAFYLRTKLNQKIFRDA